jgi:hypothetical protein
MTQRRKALTRLRDARGLLRDVEAARTAQAAARCDERERQLAGAHRDLASAVEYACDQLAGARRVAELEAAHEHVGSAREQVSEARRQVVSAAESRRAAAELLRQRERELRSTERALEMATSDERRDGDRREQRLVDDLVAARVTRREL